jgi:hypothetical protein
VNQGQPRICDETKEPELKVGMPLDEVVLILDADNDELRYRLPGCGQWNGHQRERIAKRVH